MTSLMGTWPFFGNAVLRNFVTFSEIVYPWRRIMMCDDTPSCSLTYRLFLAWLNIQFGYSYTGFSYLP